MLTTLRIKNLALVEDLTLELRPGLNIITGETGAGKSILIGALNLVLGERADRTLIRAGADACSVEAAFDASHVNDLLTEHGLDPCENGQLILKRTFSASGSNRQFINGSPATLAILARIGESLVDIHGPHEHQSLLHPAKQLAILDAFGGLQERRLQFTGLVRRQTELQHEKIALIVDEKTYAQQLDLLRFQVNEITAARLQPAEEVALGQEYQRASNSAKLLGLSQSALALLSGGDQSLLDQAGALGRSLQELQRTDPAASALLAQHEQAVALLRDLQNDLAHYSERLEIDPARLQQLETRLNLINSLKRKYGDALAFGEEAARKLQALEQRDAELERLNAAITKADAEIQSAGNELSRERRKIIPQLAKAVTKQLSALGFKQSQFDVSISAGSSVTSSGLDTIEFQFAPNPGEPPRPLRAIASSGELARVMLALKTVLAVVDQIPVLIFDEVDANVGGETASAVGEKMRQIAHSRQVLCITHLPQVAAQATAHYAVTKETRTGRTTSQIHLLEGKDRITELARMLGGQTDAARKHATALLEAPDS
ncbi:MAG TPA: DNA repair protein RecN [Verrucomicrobiae bacterium]|nr:DNA repair protein RecN [Verrucomicrobiae bacterium]